MFKQLLFFCVSTPIVLSLNVDIAHYHKSLSIILDPYIAVSRDLCSIVPQCILHCVKCSPGSAPFTLHQFLEVIPVYMEFLQFIIPLSTIVFQKDEFLMK